VHRTPSRRRLWALLSIAAGAVLLSSVGIAAVGLTIGHSSETVGGAQDATQFLSGWTETGALSGTIPAALPVVLSAVSTLPTRLPAAAANYLLGAGTAGHVAAEWTFSEAVGIGLNLEIEVAFQVQATVGGVTSSHAYTAYLETQATGPGAAITFAIFWDAGAAAGVTLVSQYELSQACASVGVCP
jgi:hypothetical protein